MFLNALHAILVTLFSLSLVSTFEQQQLVADYDLIGEAAKSVSKAIWIGNVFAPFTCKEELEETEAEAALRGRPPYLAEMESDFTVCRAEME